MTKFFEIEKLATEDTELKLTQGSSSYVEDTNNLMSLFDGQTRALQKNFENIVKLGDPQNPRPAAPSLARRLARAASVLYWVPPTRRFRGLSEEADIKAKTSLRYMVDAMDLDGTLDLADAKRQIVRQVVVLFSGAPRLGKVVSRTFTATDIMRRPSPGLRDFIAADEAIAFRIGGTADGPIEQQAWEVWQRVNDDAWDAFRVNGTGELLGDDRQPFASATRRSPYGAILPAAMLVDEALDGRAWLPIPQHRLDLILNTAGLAADVLFMAKYQAHSIRVGTAAPGQSTDDFPEETGADTTTVLPHGAKLDVLNHQPQFEAVNVTIDRLLSLLALSESLPPDAFALKRSIPLSTPALRYIYAESDRRRAEQVKPTTTFERDSYRAYAQVWVTNFPSKVPGIDPEAPLRPTFAASWSASDRREHQDTSFKDIQAGLFSQIVYVQQRDHCDRETAIETVLEARADLKAYPPIVPTGALTDDGPRAALGEGSATLDAGGGFSSDPANSVEGASVVAAVARAQAEAAALTDDM